MLATQVYRRLDRSLVLVPSDALRRQIAKKPDKPGTGSCEEIDQGTPYTIAESTKVRTLQV